MALQPSFPVQRFTRTLAGVYRYGYLSALTLAVASVLAVPDSAAGVQVTEPAVAENQTQDQDQEDLMLVPWTKLDPAGSRAEFEMPVKPRYVERTFRPIRGAAPIKVRLYIGSALQSTVSFTFSYHDLNEDPRGPKGIENTLDGAVRGSLINVDGQLLDEIQTIKLASVPGRQFVYGFVDKDENRYVVISRVFLKGRRTYQLSAVATSETFDVKVSSRFLNSFSIVEPKSDLPPMPRAPTRPVQ